ncbi:helix-turn-helix transcriptional regulator [Tahibacter amnicola]|uniref:WYL domain-containing protein n=1 Tax=Tahibacter amnicola TaxID=2976241 RepID=A0ABY6BAA3_9GAMM|nr:WYL domain-containing protein [Tahibacter amnicola]UXI66722.1 WYL domain-containing protein [Tahibacter amnicola]
MLKTSARLLRLLTLLQGRRHWTSADLCHRLDVDARTVRRDIERLRGLGYPVQASAGVGGGYRLGSGSTLPPILLEDEEAVAVAVALRAATHSVANLEETALGLLAKLDQILPARLRKRAGDLHTVTLSLGGASSAPPVERLTRIAAACRDHAVLLLNYRDHGGKPSKRRVQPLRLASAGHRWYLIAWDEDRTDWRTFRVDRISAVRDTGRRFLPQAFPGDIGDYLRRAITQAPFAYQLRLRLKGPAQEWASSLPVWCGVLEAVDVRHCILHTGADSVDALAARLLMTGATVEILDEPAFLPALRAAAERLYQATHGVAPVPAGSAPRRLRKPTR